ncbi:hypothetical protein AB4Z50_14770 [Paenibacillus sp. 2TAB26]|uniref:hypothetical protein n=1 Tax=Paenibacillus sp. 2TAB26 TaxID=3233005 RepID=UPI003F9620ED
MAIEFNMNTTLQPYLKEMIKKLPNGAKMVMQSLSKQDWNKEDLSLNSQVRRGELNFAVCWLEALGLARYISSGRQKLYTLTPLGRIAYQEFNVEFHELKEERE